MNVTANVSSRMNLMRNVLLSGIVLVRIPFDTPASLLKGVYGFCNRLRLFLRDLFICMLWPVRAFLLRRAPLDFVRPLSTMLPSPDFPDPWRQRFPSDFLYFRGGTRLAAASDQRHGALRHAELSTLLTGSRASPPAESRAFQNRAAGNRQARSVQR